MVEPCTYVIFGATGNLSRLKLMPALYHLEAADRIPEGTIILAVGRRAWNQEKWAEEVRDMIVAQARGGINEEVFHRFCSRLYYLQGDLKDAATYTRMHSMLTEESKFPANAAFYMALKPSQFTGVIDRLAEFGLTREEHGWRRLVIEKPFGYDLESAHMLQSRLRSCLDEHQVFRIDHYLGKAMVQNILVLRFANVMMEPLWDRNYIDHVQITHSETIGIEGRADYYEGAGALRDMIQSHLLQLLTFVAMEPPASMDAESLRDEKVKVLKSIRPIPQSAVHAHSFRAQYSSGVINGDKVRSYVDEEGVSRQSTMETYAALKLYIDNWRWRGVPFYIRTGKRMARSQSAISIRFKEPPQNLFRNTPVERVKPDWLLLGIQPYETVRLEMQVKESGLEMKSRTTSLEASFRQPSEPAYDAYEDLLLDVIEGDRTLFLRYDEVEWAWRVVDPILRVWAMERDFIHTYPAGTWGPEETRRLFEKEDQFWRHSLLPDQD